VLAALGMTEAPAGGPEAGRPAPAAPTYLGRFIWPRCQRAGWWGPVVKAGDTVTQGQVLGTVTSLDGAVVQETVTAPADGVLIFVTSSPAVADDGLLLGLGAA
jgi:predicted deacylase